MSRFGPALLLLASLWYPISRIIELHLTLTGSCEESLGYRYFYSLRLLYDANGYVFLPQGHLMDLVHQTVQLFLTWIGFSRYLVFPRIDLFSYISIAFAHLLAALAFYNLSSSIATLPARIAVLCAVLVPFFNVPISGFNVILEPDYMLWILPLMLVAASSAIGVVTGDFIPWTQRDSWTLAGLVTAALGLKATLLIYPISFSVVLLVNRKGLKSSFIQAVTATVLGVLGWLLVLLIYYHGHWDSLIRYFDDEARFGSSVRPDASYLPWLRAQMIGGHWLVKCSVLLPPALLLLLAMSRSRSRVGLILGVLAGALMYHFFLFFRDTPVTWFEAANFTVFAVILFSFAPVLQSPSLTAKLAMGIVALAAATQVFDGVRYMHRYFIPYLVSLNHAQAEAAAALAPYHDRIAFLTPDNSYRTLTIDSAVFKGGSNILEGPFFGKSALIRAIYPNRWYFTEPPDAYAASPIDLRPYEAVVFVVRKGLDPEPAGQLALMKKHYGPALSSLTLRHNIDFGSQEFLVWEVNQSKQVSLTEKAPSLGRTALGH